MPVYPFGAVLLRGNQMIAADGAGKQIAYDSTTGIFDLRFSMQMPTAPADAGQWELEVSCKVLDGTGTNTTTLRSNRYPFQVTQ